MLLAAKPHTWAAYRDVADKGLFVNSRFIANSRLVAQRSSSQSRGDPMQDDQLAPVIWVVFRTIGEQ